MLLQEQLSPFSLSTTVIPNGIQLGANPSCDLLPGRPAITSHCGLIRETTIPEFFTCYKRYVPWASYLAAANRVMQQGRQLVAETAAGAAAAAGAQTECRTGELP